MKNFRLFMAVFLIGAGFGYIAGLWHQAAQKAALAERSGECAAQKETEQELEEREVVNG